LKSNRLVNPDGKENIPISQAEIPPGGQVVHLKGYGFIKVFRAVSQNRDVGYWTTDDLHMDGATQGELESQGWGPKYITGGPSSAAGLSGRKYGRLWCREITFFMPCGHFCFWRCTSCEQELVGMRQRCPLSGRQYALI